MLRGVYRARFDQIKLSSNYLELTYWGLYFDTKIYFNLCLVLTTSYDESYFRASYFIDTVYKLYRCLKETKGLSPSGSSYHLHHFTIGSTTDLCNHKILAPPLSILCRNFHLILKYAISVLEQYCIFHEYSYKCLVSSLIIHEKLLWVIALYSCTQKS